jgi:thiamine kinase-like enzyme
MRARTEPTVPCNNDLLAENFLWTGEEFRLIDYEYSGNNEASFELGNVWSESNLSLDQLEELVGAYWGEPLRNKVARARLWGLMSKYGWTLWASIQDGVSELDFDFWSWGMEKYERAIEEFDGPQFEQLLSDVQRED